MLSINSDKCINDGICSQVCARGLIHKNEKREPYTIDGAANLCIGCGHCIITCPTGALTHKLLDREKTRPIMNDLNINIEEAEQFFCSRRSVRNFKDKPVEQEKLKKLVEIAGFAPSGHNLHSVHFTIAAERNTVRKITNEVVKGLRYMIAHHPEIASELGFKAKVRQWENDEDRICYNAPSLIVAHAQETGPTSQEDCLLALSYIELFCTALKLGATWAGYVMRSSQNLPFFADLLKVPDGSKCFGALLIGYPKYKTLKIPSRRIPSISWL